MDLDESIVKEPAIENRLNPVTSENTSLSEEVNLSEPMNSVATEGQAMLNEAPVGLPTRNEDNMIPLTSILDQTSSRPHR